MTSVRDRDRHCVWRKIERVCHQCLGLSHNLAERGNFFRGDACALNLQKTRKPDL